VSSPPPTSKMGGESKKFYSGGDGQMGGMSESGEGFKFDGGFQEKNQIFGVKFVEIGYKTSKKAYKTAFQNKFH